MKPKILIYSILIFAVFLTLVSCGAKAPAPEGTTDSPAGFPDERQEAKQSGTALADWPGWRGTRADNISQETDWDPASINGINNLLVNNHPRLSWKKKIGIGYSGITIAGPYLYTMGFVKGRSLSNGLSVIYCLDARTGREIWTLTYSIILDLNFHPGPRVQPLVQDNKLYTLDHDGQLYCLDPATGEVWWHVDVKQKFGYSVRSPDDFGFCGAPVIDGDMLVINANTAGIALNKNTGETIWASEQGAFGYAAPVVFSYNNKKYAAIFSYYKLYVVELETGTIAASFDWETYSGCNIADPIIVGNKIFISSSYDKGCALLEFNGTSLGLVWQGTQMKHHMSPGVLIGGYYYGNDGWYNIGFGQYRCLEYATGKIMWTIDQGFGLIGAIGDWLVLLSDSGRLSFAKATPAGLDETAVAQLSHKLHGNWFTPPTIVRSHLYVRSKEGDLFSINISKQTK